MFSEVPLFLGYVIFFFSVMIHNKIWFSFQIWNKYAKNQRIEITCSSEIYKAKYCIGSLAFSLEKGNGKVLKSDMNFFLSS